MNPSEFPSPLSPFSIEPGELEFRTKVSWSAYDLGSALASLDSIYSTFVLARHLAIDANRRIQRSVEELDRYWTLLERQGPHLDFLFHEWRHLLRRIGPGAATLMNPFGPLQGGTIEQVSANLLASELEYYLQNPGEYMATSRALRVKKIEIASPGGFTLEGMGEPLRELRELIKDLCYRNRQEREKGDLEILKQKIEIIGDRNLSIQQVQVLAMSAVSDAEEVGRLINDGHLLIEGEDREAANNARSVKKRKRRKRTSTK